MPRNRKKRLRQSPAKSYMLGFSWQVQRSLVFIFFALAPLIFFSGLTPDGQLYCTLYDLPKFYFIAAFAFFLAAFYCWSIGKDSVQTAELIKFLLANQGLRLLALWFILMFFSCFQALILAPAFFTLFHYFTLLVLYVVLGQLFSSASQRWTALYGLIFSLVIVVPVGIAQFWGSQVPFLMPIKGPASTFGYRNPAAHFIALVLPFVIFATWRHWRCWRAKGSAGQLSLFVGLLLLAAAALALLFMNHSRTAIMALLAETLVVPFFLLLSKKEGLHGRLWKRRNLGLALAYTLLLGVVISALVMAFPESRKRAESSFKKFKRGGLTQLLEVRYYHWGNTLMMIKENPVLGVGLGNWRASYPLYYKSFAKDPAFNLQMTVRKTHNDYLQLAAECGIPALLLFLLLWGRQFYLLRYATADSDGEEDWRLPLAASLLAFSVIMFFSFPMQMAYRRMFFFFLLALGEARVWPVLSR